MKVFLLALAVLLLAGACYLRKLGERYRKSSEEVVRLVIMVKDQEPWVEGFVRKLFRLSREMTGLKILVIDDGSSDQTREVLVRLQGEYPFELALTQELNDRVEGGSTVAESPAAGHFFDVRVLTGSNLLNAPVFSQLKSLNAGKSHDVSK